MPGEEEVLNVALIRFTQEHVYDSFNANSDKASLNVVGLIESILKGDMTPRDLPLIRVAAKGGAYWCVDNRRLFVYKHCQLGQIPVELCSWKGKENREFELKWRNGRATRQITSGGRRVGIVQRTQTPFPRSPVMEPSLSEMSRFLAPDAQRRHDAAIKALRRTREEAAEKDGDSDSDVCKRNRLRQLLEAPQSHDEDAVAAKKKNTKKKRCRQEDANAEIPVPRAQGSDTRTESMPKPKRPKAKKRTAKSGAVVSGSATMKSSAGLTVTMDDSDDDEAYAVEVTEM